MVVVACDLLTPGTRQWNELTPRYAIESYRVVLRELSRLPRLLQDLRGSCQSEEEWSALWGAAGLDGKYAERLAAVHQEQLQAEDERLREQEHDLERRVEETRAQQEHVRLRRAQIQHELGLQPVEKDEIPAAAPALDERAENVASNTKALRTPSGRRARGTVALELLQYVKRARSGVTALKAGRDLRIKPKYCYALGKNGLLYKQDQFFFLSEAGEAALREAGIADE
jgi:hypothetical protein